MTKPDNEVLDSQILSENVGFLENCFDNSFSLHSSLCVVKECVFDDYKPVVTYSGNVSRKINATEPNITGNFNKSIKDNKILQCLQTKTVNKSLKDWGLPIEISKKYESRGITEMFDWQVECLSNPKILMNCCNLVYSAPTSAGKTLVAEIVSIKTILERQKKVIIILPFVSIVREKTFYLQDVLSSSGIRVEGFMGSQSPPGGLQAVHIAICTIEKANSLVNRLLDEGNISELGAVIVDELHLLGDPHRGYILELLLTKIKFVSSKFDDTHIQIIGMSATLPNLDILANWLEAELYITQFRPIPLDEFCLVGNKYYNKDGQCVSSLNNTNKTSDSDNVLQICLDTLSESCSVLIFCMTKNRCESLAQTIASSFYKIGCSGNEMGTMLRDQLKTENIFEVLEQLKSCPVSLDEVLKNTISFGVAYHHAGLTFDERDIIEGAFKTGAIRVLVATSTLSSGVNLPARKVIIRTPIFQRQPINILTYKQMIGRAGRMGKDKRGESILICTEAEKKIGFDLMMGALKPVTSCIESEDKFMRAVLEMIASQVVCTKIELELYSKCTLLFTQNDEMEFKNTLVDNTLKELENYELVRIQNDDNEMRYIATPLGKACLTSSMAPNDGLSLFCELQKARQCLVLETDLHLIYLVTPYSVSSQWGEIDWLHFLTLWESLTKAMKRVGELVGIHESFIIRCLRGYKINGSQNQLNIHRRFYTALALQDLVNEVPLSEVATKFQCARGFLQSLQQASATFAGMVTAFCHQLRWKNMEMLISQFQDRLHFGIHLELLELMKLPSLNGIRARSLFDSGFDTITSIASADINQIELALHKAVPFQSEKERDDGDVVDARKRNKIKNVWITGCCAMTPKEAAENLINESRLYLQYEIGVSDIKWDKSNANNNIDEPSLYPKQGSFVNEKHLKEESPEAVVKIEIVSQGPMKLEDDVINNVSRNSSDKLPNPSAQDLPSKVKLEKTVMQSKNHLKDITNPCTSIRVNKDDIEWDSLNFNDSIIENVTINRNVFSPNISFGDEEKPCLNRDFKNSSSSKVTSIKDISLFSSDGDNSSLFEDSLPLDLIPSKLLNNEEVNLKPKISTEMIDTTSQLVNINSNTILNAFKSTLIDLDDDDDDDIKLVYEEENKAGGDCEIRNSTYSEVEVIGTQNVDQVSIKKCYVSPFKRHINHSNEITIQPCKKIRREFELKNNKFDIPTLNAKTSKKTLLYFKNVLVNCVILREQDVIESMNVLDRVDEIAVYLDINQRTFTSNEIIGSKVFGYSNDNSSFSENFKSITFCCGSNLCIYLDLFSLRDNKMLHNLKDMLRQQFRRKITWKILSMQSVFNHIKRFCGVEFPLSCVDILLSEWLIDSDEKPRSIFDLAKKYCDIDLSTLSIHVDRKEKKFRNLEPSEEICLRTWLLWEIGDKQKRFLLNQCDVQNTIDVEIHVSKILSNCGCYGVTVDKDLAARLLIDVKNSQETLQKKAFKICGYHFNFNSSKDVAKVIGIYRGRKVSTKKSVLTAHNSPMSSIIIYWRKLNSILTKTLYPLTEKACIYSEGDRINPSYTMFTCTGRVSMHEPNLQNVPRTFFIPAKYLSVYDDDTSDDVVEFNCRNIFKAGAGHVLVSADYCQLEMRILTHYSEDPVLMKIMNSNEDVFRSIAASWGSVPDEEVDDDLRQKAKQLCYGIIYGMGNKTLSQHLDVTEMEAAVFMDTFHRTYPAIKAFTSRLVEDCKAKGYVETLTKRRRHLPDINSPIPSKKCTAERQAVNTTIQGSAADIAKAAMCGVDARTGHQPHPPRLLLQMHDELIYEVPETYKHTFISILKEVMEQTVRLKVPLPVKVKVGYTWGSLEEIKI